MRSSISILLNAAVNRLLTAVMEFPELTGIGIDESTAILVRDHQAEVIGESQVLFHITPTKPEPEKMKVSCYRYQPRHTSSGRTFSDRMIKHHKYIS